MNQAEQIEMKIAELETAITSQHPQMSQYLKLIHMQLLKEPELVHIMTNEQRAVLISGLEKQAGITVFNATKPKKPTAKSMATASLADFGI
jgi:hypothetical protein